MKKYIIILFSSLMATIMQAQEEHNRDSISITAMEERVIYQKIYKLVQDYAQAAAVSNEEEEYHFRELFVSNDLQICNDLMSLSRDATLSVDDYVTALQKAKSVKVKVKNLKKIGSIKETADAWTLRVEFKKNIIYSRCGTYFESERYFGDSYKILADLSVDKRDYKCKIYGLSIDPDQYPPLVFPEKFSVLVRTLEDENKRDYLRDDKLTIDGQEVHNMWNRFGQIILHEGQVIRYNNSKVEEEEVEKDADCYGGRKIRAKYNDQAFRLKINMGYSLMGFNKLSGGNSNITSNDGETSFGIDIGCVLPSNSKFYMGFFTGLGLSINNMEISLSPSENGSAVENGVEDEDGDSYTRYYILEGEGVKQKFSTSELTIPVYADFEYQFIPSLSVYANIGARLQLTTDKWEAQIDRYTTYGEYSGYGEPLKIDGSVNLNGFGQHQGRSMEVDRNGLKSSMSVSALMGMGLRANITKSLAVDAGVQYLMGGTSWKMENGSYELFSYTLPDEYEGMTAEQKSQGDKVNLLTQVKGINRSAFRLTLGLILKF